MTKTAGAAIKRAIARKGWTQAHAALRIGISEAYLSELITGSRLLSVRMAARIAPVLRLSALRLLSVQMRAALRDVARNPRRAQAAAKQRREAA